MDLQPIIQEVERASSSEDPLDRLAVAADHHHDLTDQADQLLDHFVKAARDAGCSWAEIGEVLGVSKQAAQQRHTKRLALSEWGGKRSGRRSHFFAQFTDRARATVFAAQLAAKELRHNYIGTEHVLIGLLDDPEGLGAKVLQQHGITREAVVADVEDIIGPGGGDPEGCEPSRARRGRLRGLSQVMRNPVPFTPRAKKVLELAVREARDLDHNYLGTEHILLAVLREGDGVAAQILINRGLTREAARQSVDALLAAG